MLVCLLKFGRNLNASALVSSERMYINKVRHVHLFTGCEDVSFTDDLISGNNLISCSVDYRRLDEHWLETESYSDGS